MAGYRNWDAVAAERDRDSQAYEDGLRQQDAQRAYRDRAQSFGEFRKSRAAKPEEYVATRISVFFGEAGEGEFLEGSLTSKELSVRTLRKVIEHLEPDDLRKLKKFANDMHQIFGQK